MADENIVIGLEPDKSSFDQAFSGLSSAALKAATAVSAAFAGAFAFREIVAAGIESERAVTAFNTALASTGKFTQEASDSFQNFATNLELLTNVQDEVILKGAALVTNLSGLTGPALERASSAALNLAQALQIGPEQAFELVGKAATGNTAALGRYGIKLDETTPKTERFGELLRIIETRFGGAAEAAATTFGGSLERVRNGFSNVVESTGLLLTKSPELIAFFSKLGEIFNKLAQFIAGQNINGFITSMINGFLAVSNVITFGVIAPLEQMFNVVRFIGQTLAVNIQEFMIVPFMNFTATIIEVGSKLGIFSADVKQAFFDARDAAQGALQDMQSTNDQLAVSLAETPFTDVIGTQIQELDYAVQTATTNMTNNVSNMAMTSAQQFDDMAKRAEAMNKVISSAVAGGISSAIQRIIGAVAAGRASFENFVKIVMSIMGDMAINVGTTLIGAGIGIEALKSLGGSAAVAAGVGLVAVGSILKALAGDGGGGGQTASAGGGGGGFTGGSPSTVTEAVDQEIQQNQRVVVNIQGNVLDRRETGLAISEIIQESFDSQRTKVVGAV